ncbi:MAG: ATP-binding protein [Rikenellaceae bacterium]
MNTPFIFGKIAQSENFTDRDSETDRLVMNFTSLINTVIISPRRWGKSSLVAKSAELAMQRDENLRICRIDLFNVRNEEHFYELLAYSILKSTSTKVEEIIGGAKRFFSHLLPKISLSADGVNEVSLQLNWEEVKRQPDAILDLAERIATEKGLKIVVCIDEFQNVSEFGDPLYFQKKLRSHWQLHQNTAYCLYGSKRHMMLDVFTSSSMPFYKFGDILFLEKIATPAWVGFISERFSATGKSIMKEEIEQIVSLAENHPYYVQQLAQQCWLRTDSVCSAEVVTLSHITIVEQLSLLFVTITEGLTTKQLGILKAIIAGEKNLSSQEVLTKYKIGSSATVNRARKSLIDKDILDNRANVVTFQDPMYKYWLKHEYFSFR